MTDFVVSSTGFVIFGLLQNSDILGFYVTFDSKTMRLARAYYSNIGSFSSAYRKPCPLRMLIDMGRRGWEVPEILKTVGRGSALKTFLQMLIKCKVLVIALCIGGRTWNLTNGMDR